MVTQIVALNVTATNAGGTAHRHISEVKTASGRVLTRSELIRRIASGEEDFFTIADGEEARVVVVQCPVCLADDYIKTMADGHIFVSGADVKNRIDRIKDAMDALKLAIEFEKDSVLFFLGIEDAVTAVKDRELIKSLVKEELGHLRRLTLELRKISKA